MHVTNVAQLNAAIIAAVGGETISCAPGDYIGITALATARAFSPSIRITSDNQASPAVLHDFNITGCSGIWFTYVDFEAAAANNPFHITNSTGIFFDNIRGYSNAATPLGSTSSDVFVFNGCTNCSVSNSQFFHVKNGLFFGGTGFIAYHNQFHDLQSDGMDFSQAVNVEAYQNYIHDTQVPVGAHPDFFQLFTANTTTASNNINVHTNCVWRGLSGQMTQGIFITLTYTYNPRIQNVTVNDNLLVGTNANAICVTGCDGVTIIGNQLYRFPDQVMWVRTGNNTNQTVSGNVIHPAVTDQGVAVVNAWLAQYFPGVTA